MRIYICKSKKDGKSKYAIIEKIQKVILDVALAYGMLWKKNVPQWNFIGN